MMSCQKSLLAYALAAIVHAPFAVADEGDVFSVNAGLTMMHDNNMFRLTPSANPAAYGLPGRSDTITQTSVGLKADKMLGRQQLIADVNFIDSSYKRNSYLDFQALNYDAKWLWAFGNRWTGELSLDRKETLNTFSDYTSYKNRNVRTADNERFTANYWFHTSWAAMLGVSRYNLTNEKAFLEDSDYEASGFNYGIRYRPVSGNSATLRVKQLDGSYTKREFNVAAQSDNGFSHSSVEADSTWLVSGKMQLHGRLEYLERKHDHFSSRDFSGWAGNFDVVYSMTGKSNLTFGYKHGLDAFQYSYLASSAPFGLITTSYYNADEFNLGARWAATSKLDAGATLGYGWREYGGEIVPLPSGVDRREERFTRAGFNVGYRPIRWLELRGGTNYEKRNVNDDRYDYKDRVTYFSLNAQY